MTYPQAPQTVPVADWYPDPAQPGRMRWWSGQGWTEHVSAPAPVAVEEERWTPVNLVVPQGKSLGVRALVWGIIAVLIPVVVLPGLLAIAFGASGLVRVKEYARRGIAVPGKGLATAGVVLGAMSLLVALAAIVALVSLS